MNGIGIFGGTFDPPHLGHLILAAEARFQLALARVLWVLTPFPPHKEGRPITPLHHRLAMVQRVVAQDEGFEFSDVEIQRPAPHYTVETLQSLREKYPQERLVLLLGGDSLRDLPSWSRPDKLIALCDEIGVMRRPGDVLDLLSLDSLLPGIRERVRFVNAPLLEISSREIRRRIAQGWPFRYYLPPAIYEYIQEHGLYQSAADTSSQHG
ncbi:MAG: nicotinate-nucleotide adenylyltransferase [Anaerolineales bacterium]